MTNMISPELISKEMKCSFKIFTDKLVHHGHQVLLFNHAVGNPIRLDFLVVRQYKDMLITFVNAPLAVMMSDSVRN